MISEMDNQDHDAGQTTNKGGRPAKKDKYDVERQQVIERLDTIIGITDSNKLFYLYDLDNDVDKQNQILALEDEVKRVFRAGNWNVFAKEVKTRKYLSLLRAVYRDMGYSLMSTAKSLKRDGKSVRSAGYLITDANV